MPNSGRKAKEKIKSLWKEIASYDDYALPGDMEKFYLALVKVISIHLVKKGGIFLPFLGRFYLHWLHPKRAPGLIYRHKFRHRDFVDESLSVKFKSALPLKQFVNSDKARVDIDKIIDKIKAKLV